MRPSTKRFGAHRGKARATTLPTTRTVEVVIETLGGRGDGVAHLDGETVFVPFTVPGDRVSARIESRRGDGLAASLIDVLESGPDRCEAPCSHYGRCGGCTVQHVAAASYGDWKRSLLTTALSRAGMGAVPVEPLVRIPPGQRRRAALAFSRRRGGVVSLGFNARASHAVVDVEHCLQLDPALSALLPPLREVLIAVVADGEDGDVIITRCETGADIVIEAEARLDLFDRERLAAFAEAADLARLSWRRPGSSTIDPIARRRPALVYFGGIAVEPSPGGFLQPTGGGEAAIAMAVQAGVSDAARVADLFSGCGSFTFPLAAQGKTVHAVEGEEAPIRALEAAAHRDGLAVTAEVRDLARRPLLPHELTRFDAVVFDPPRAGAQAQAEILAQGGPKRVVAVSCNPATLVRDLKVLQDGGYGIDRVIPIDQFPFAAHLETVVTLTRR